MKSSLTNDRHEIQWREVRDIPNQPGFKLTVKRSDGELINTCVVRSPVTHACSLGGISVGEVKGWIPNNEA